jgi:hypothetical protein
MFIDIGVEGSPGSIAPYHDAAPLGARSLPHDRKSVHRPPRRDDVA